MLQILEQAVLGGGFRGTFEAMEPYSAVRTWSCATLHGGVSHLQGTAQPPLMQTPLREDSWP